MQVVHNDVVETSLQMTFMGCMLLTVDLNGNLEEMMFEQL